MATTPRLGLTLIAEASAQKATQVNTMAQAIDTAIAGLALANAFTNTNSFSNTSTFTGAVKLGGTIGGNGAGMPWKQSTITYPSDADYAITTTESEARTLLIANGVITAPRNLVVPGTTGAEWIIVNNQTVHAITVKTAAGTGITVAASRTAICRTGGVNVTRCTADSLLT